MADWNAWTIAYVQQNFPSLTWAINHPELGGILAEAVQNGWTEEIIVAKVKQTAWYKSTSDAQRQWELLTNDNPGEAAKMVSGGISKVNQLAARLGLTLSWEDSLFIGTAAVANAWSEEQILSNLVTNIAGQRYAGAGQQGGLLGAYQDMAMQRAQEWFIPMSEEQGFEFAKQLATNSLDQQGLDAYLRDQAVSRFPTLKDSFEQGFTAKQVFDPYIQQTAQLLETTPGQINMTDQKWMPMIDTVDSNGGVRRPMSLAEAGRYVRSQDEWRYTSQAQEQGARLAETILQKFGEVAQ